MKNTLKMLNQSTNGSHIMICRLNRKFDSLKSAIYKTKKTNLIVLNEQFL